MPERRFKPDIKVPQGVERWVISAILFVGVGAVMEKNWHISDKAGDAMSAVGTTVHDNSRPLRFWLHERTLDLEKFSRPE